MRKSREATSAVRIFLYFIRNSNSKVGGLVLGIKYPPVEVCKRPTLPGLLQLLTLCGVSLNPPDRPSFRTSPTMSFSIHLPCRSKGSLGLTVSRPSTVINYSPNSFRTSSISELLQQRGFYSNQTPSKFLRRSTAFRIPAELLLRAVPVELLREPSILLRAIYPGSLL